ncbi:MAG: TIGR03792 family protein [Lyngbya sp. HA4199-MV5]|jgi:uncharacterized protein (TIGR03792 family)|nr:TIGR03792 family protein [Lyngbya sp. HA4199-MV5]
MVIEWLKIQVVPELREKYIQKDEEIWTTALSKYPGYLGKQVWIDPNNLDKVVLVSYWASREAWKTVPAKDLEAIEARFAQQMGKDTYKIVEEGEYQVRKFPQGQPKS